ncbi:MAG: inactive transglutaminase family protein [Legionellales bacterium]|nr:inactive transglutaminase family protein [Legionellales bacterium]
MTATQRHLYGLITALLIIGLSLFFYRHQVLDVPFTDTENVNSWMIEANLHFTSEPNVPVKASFNIPYLPPNFTILDEYFVAQNYGITTSLNGYNRQVVWSLRRATAKSQSLYYRAIVRETDNGPPVLGKPPHSKVTLLDENQKIAVNAITKQAREISADIQTFAQATLTELNKKSGNAKLLVGNQFDDTHLIDAAILILNQAKVPAILIQGLHLIEQKKANIALYLGVYNGQEWVYLNPKTSAAGFPKNFLSWQYGAEPMFDVMGGKKAQFSLTISPTPINALSIAKTHGLQTESQLLRFSPLQLPIHVQETYKILLTLPIGAFIILILRNFIGLKTFGTFMPVLIALAFRETHVILGVSLFTLLVSLGLMARFYLEKLRLLLVPRLAAILTVVVLLMLTLSIVSQNLGLEAGLSAALFPMVILTMTIERMCISWDERGASDALKSGSGSMIAAVIAYFAMSYQPLQYLIFAFPELLLILLALNLWFGQYRGYRLFELMRFNALSREKAC